MDAVEAPLRSDGRGFLGRHASRFVDVREGEARVVVVAFVALLGIVGGHTILETARDVMFLSALPAERLALVYLLVAVVSLGAAAANGALVARVGQRAALTWTLLVAAIGTSTLYALPKTELVLFVLYVWGSLLGVLLTTQFWMYAARLFTIAQAKRLFNPIAAGGVVGGFAGTSIAASLVGLLPIGWLLLVAAASFGAVALLVGAHRVSPREGDGAVAEQASSDGVTATMRRSPYLRRMLLLTLLSTAVLLAIDYLFKAVAVRHVDRASLGIFFARSYFGFNVLSLLFQVFAATRLLRRYGVIPGLMLLPVLIALGSAGVLVSGSAFVAAIAAKAADGTLRYSLNRVGSELLWMPVPVDDRSRTKVLLDSGVARGAQAAMALLLLGVAATKRAELPVLSAVVAALSIGWAVNVAALKRPYLDLFRQALSRGAIDASSLHHRLDLNSLEVVMEALSSRNARKVIAAIDIVEANGRTRLVPGLIFFHESEAVLLRALKLADVVAREDSIPLVARLIGHPSDAVAIAAVDALAGLGRLDALRAALGAARPVVVAHAAVHLAVAKEVIDPRDDAAVRALLDRAGESGEGATLALLTAISDHADKRWAAWVLETAKDPRPVVARRAMEAMAKLSDPRFLPFLVERLADRDTRALAREALVAQGEAALDVLEAKLRDPRTQRDVRVHLPRTISRFGTQRAADVLARVLDEDPLGQLAYKALRGLGRLVADRGLHVDAALASRALRANVVECLTLDAIAEALQREPRDDDGLLRELVLDLRRLSLERAFRLLQIQRPKEDIRSAFLAIESGDRVRRARAVEYLDALTFGVERARSVRNELDLLRLAVEDLPAEERAARARAILEGLPRTREEALAALVKSGDETMALFARRPAPEPKNQETRQGDGAHAARWN